MSTIHSIQVSDGNGSTYTATRTSKTREYAACVVRTVTEASIAIDLANHAKAEADIAEHTATLDARKAQFNMDLDGATAVYEAQKTAWYARYFNDGMLKACNYNHDRAEIELAKLLPNPHDVTGTYGIIDAQHKLDSAKNNLAKPIRVLGAQTVESWHRNTTLAHKALATYHARGDKFTVHTDSATRETAKRGSKAA